MSYQYSDFPNKYDFQNWEYFENINNIDKDNIVADREYLVNDNKRLSAQFANIVLDAIRAIEKFVQDLNKKKPNVSDAEGVLPIAHGGTGATTAPNALKNLGLTATAAELNYVKGVTSGIQNQLDNKLNLRGSGRGSVSYNDFDINVSNTFQVDVGEDATTILTVKSDGIYIDGNITTSEINVGGQIINQDLTDKLSNKSDKEHIHVNASAVVAGFMSPADKKKLDSISEGAGTDMDKYVLKNGNGTLNIGGYNDIYLSPNSTLYIESTANEIASINSNQFQISPDIKAKGNLTIDGTVSGGTVETKELRVHEINTSTNNVVYTIHTDVDTYKRNRLDFFKITGCDSLVKMTFEPTIFDGVASANGTIEIEGDVDIDSGNKLSVQAIASDNHLFLNCMEDFSINSPRNLYLGQSSSSTLDGNSAQLCIKGASSADRKGGTLVFSRNDQDILRIGEKDDEDGQPIYNQFRFEGDEVHFLLNSTGSMFQATADQVQIRYSGRAKLVLDKSGVQTTELYFLNLGFAGISQERESYLKSTTVQRIVNDILDRLDTLENGSSGGGGNCEAITEEELNAMFEEIGL